MRFLKNFFRGFLPQYEVFLAFRKGQIWYQIALRVRLLTIPDIPDDRRKQQTGAWHLFLSQIDKK
jgi:hypothetical protein